MAGDVDTFEAKITTDAGVPQGDRGCDDVVGRPVDGQRPEGERTAAESRRVHRRTGCSLDVQLSSREPDVVSPHAVEEDTPSEGNSSEGEGEAHIETPEVEVRVAAEKVWIDGALMFDADNPKMRPVSDFELGQPGEGDVK